MKTIRTLFLLLFSATAAFAQLTPNDLLITGSVLDSTGQGMANMEVCVTLAPNNITFPLDTLCTTTDSTGSFTLVIFDGSASGPNVAFEVFTSDPCSNPINPSIVSETVSNGQGTVDTATVALMVCTDPNTGCNLVVDIGTQVDTSGGSINTTLSAIASGGTAPYSYLWSNGSTFSTISDVPSGTYCVTVTDTEGCVVSSCVTVGSNTPNCDAGFTYTGPTPIGYTFSADVQDQNLDYYWSIDASPFGEGFEANAPGLSNGVYTICLTVIDSLAGCSDTQCADITVGANNCVGFISGSVSAGSANNPLDQGVVYLITFDANTNELTLVDSAVVTPNSYYSFGPLDCGDYLIKGAATPGSAYYADHIPTYFGNSPFWGFAETVTIGQANTQVTADVVLISANNPGGPGFIGGNVTEGANKVGPGDPVVGVEVVLFNISGEAIAYTYTDDNGDFGFSNLAYGTYQVYVEVLGVQTIPAVVTIGVENPSVDDILIFASETLISTGIVEFDFEGAISDVFPNPVLNEAKVQFDLEIATQVNVSILDLTGRTISTQRASLSAGRNTLNVSADQLKGGYYFLNIQDVEGVFSVTRKFMRID